MTRYERILNLKIKDEVFSTISPSILREQVSNCLKLMMYPYVTGFKIKEKNLDIRLSMMEQALRDCNNESNERYYLISKFYDETDVPILLNTSFNENEPIVCKPDEALETFLGLRWTLVLEN